MKLLYIILLIFIMGCSFVREVKVTGKGAKATIYGKIDGITYESKTRFTFLKCNCKQ